MTSQSRIFVALDYADCNAARELVAQLNPEQCGLKVGKELFTRGGAELVKEFIAAGFDVFLDLKFHDIPTTVAKAVRAAAELGVWMVNVHASGGSRMLTAAREALEGLPKRPYLIAVTVLTSMEQADLAEVGVQGTVAEQVERLAQLTYANQLDGVVCSAHEAEQLKQKFGADFMLVTPGIRPQGAALGDQRRVMTPVQASQLGIEVLVIGRPITQAPDPARALAEIYASLT